MIRSVPYNDINLTILEKLMEKGRLKWAIRRGMLELDLILEGFVKRHYDELSPADKDRFHDLLTCEDNKLHQWLVKHEEPAEEFKQYAPMVRKIVEDAMTI